MNYAGAVTTWLKDGLELVSCPEETEALACRADPGDHTYLVPAFTGIGAPDWVVGASACFVGMCRLTGRERSTQIRRCCNEKTYFSLLRRRYGM